MDSNKDGVVTKDELKTLLKGLGEEVTDDVVEEMINIADENGDGTVDFKEFVAAATNGSSEHPPGSPTGSWTGPLPSRSSVMRGGGPART
eukprot:CAMPEP_0168607384 /NCGR_PEP_ID=MMETSP0449_2-20121227/7_1 /TAXON_ID=1082188 /ORGANISM="Strombidium rassoulzadegani, Strain ras09" /LENGTH=89 /DNA_ID=CAMNT_0008647183 /DNA_START=107 /DNA_END=377 /DNA_ORIENTATION=-